MVDEQQDKEERLELFSHAISVEALQQQDPSVSLHFEQLPDQQQTLSCWRFDPRRNQRRAKSPQEKLRLVLNN